MLKLSSRRYDDRLGTVRGIKKRKRQQNKRPLESVAWELQSASLLDKKEFDGWLPFALSWVSKLTGQPTLASTCFGHFRDASPLTRSRVSTVNWKNLFPRARWHEKHKNMQTMDRCNTQGCTWLARAGCASPGAALKKRVFVLRPGATPFRHV